ncbi:MAG: pentapeptide repeat-containing protein [Rhodopseudomonas sp.]|jgi:uncharacterized protein YjbI with pentapeptide repeats|uniref:pentapeptide repeat-containing protein n=1 Tax=Rhodopseudomonas sp. TaxID=1078 RepID=UPI0039E4A176
MRKQSEHGQERALNISGAFVRRTDLSGASLRGANLAGADAANANFRGADFEGAILDGTVLRGADLTDAKNLTVQQLSRAIVDRTTVLPAYIDQAALRVTQ